MFAVISEFAVCRSRFAICNANETDRRAAAHRVDPRRGCSSSRPDDNPCQQRAFSRSLRCRRRRAVFDIDRAARVPDGSYAQSRLDSRDSRSYDASAFSALQRYIRTLCALVVAMDMLWCQSDAKWWHLCNIVCHFASRLVAMYFTPVCFRIFR